MSYYILPKIITSFIEINSLLVEEEITTNISHSLFNYYEKMNKQLNKIKETDQNLNVDYLLKLINPYDFIFSIIPNTNFSISKLKQKTRIFYDILEIINMLSIFEKHKNSLNFITISTNHHDINSCYELFREKYSDNLYNYIELNISIYEEIKKYKYDIIFYEIEDVYFSNLNNYVLKLIDILLLILKTQTKNGTTIIKISYIFHKPVIDILYLLTSIYEKVYIVKPNTSNIMSYEKYIVCKNFILNEEMIKTYSLYITKLAEIKKKYKNNNIKYIIDKDMPCFYTNKIDDINNIIGQQQLETFDLVINIYKNKNKDDRIDSIKKINISKCINWCEKMKIPHNKFIEKPNIFLPILGKDETNELIVNGDELIVNGDELIVNGDFLENNFIISEEEL
jgi:hypothetical protein